MTPTRRDILQVLEALSLLYPDMRFGQLVVNISNWATRVPDALWDLEDEAFLEVARKHLAKRVRDQAGPESQAAAGAGR